MIHQQGLAIDLRRHAKYQPSTTHRTVVDFGECEVLKEEEVEEQWKEA